MLENSKLLFLSCILHLASCHLKAQGFPCPYTWSPAEPIYNLKPPHPEVGSNKLASSNDHVNLLLQFRDLERVQGTCLPAGGALYYSSYPGSRYTVQFTVNNPAHASFSDEVPLNERTVDVSIHHMGNGSITPGVVILSHPVYINDLVTLFFQPAWSPVGVPLADPPPVIVRATITDVTPMDEVPPGHAGNCRDAANFTYTWTFRYTARCPEALARIPTTTRDNVWIPIFQDHTPQTCNVEPLEDIVPFCYVAEPSIPPLGADYTDRIITERFENQIADFTLDDLNEAYRAANPGLMTANDFAALIFPHAVPHSFTIDNNDRIEDSHGANSLGIAELLLEAFNVPALRNNRVMYHFMQNYLCNGDNILGANIARRLTNTGGNNVEPELRKTH